MNSKQRLRIRIIGLLVLVCAFILASSLYTTGISKGNKYAEKAQAQYAKPLTSLFDRGTIFMTGKDGAQTAAATVGSGYLLFMNPKLVTDPAGSYEALSHSVKLDKETFMTKAKKVDDPYEELLHRVDAASAETIRMLALPGIGVVPESWRAYPGGALSSHEIGVIGEDRASSTVAGRYGLEKFYNDILSRNGVESSVNIFAQLFSGLTSVFGSKPDEGDIVTTIEPRVESYLEKTLQGISKAWQADEIGGIIMDPSTGELIALSSIPTFDPNDLKSLSSASALSNPLVEHVYEMGSIMKPITLSVGLDAGVISVKSTYEDSGCMTLDEKTICNFDKKARGITPMQEILNQSLNMGAATVALKTGANVFVKYFKSLGITSKSLVDLPNEAMPLTGSFKRPKDIDIATASYGQGIALSPLGMTRALAVLANGGYVVKPHLVKEIDFSDGRVEKTEIKRDGPVLKPQTIEDIKLMLVTVVDEALAKGTIKKEHYTMAAKTGTASIADHVNGGYYQDRFLHSFFGFFPAYKPRFIIFLYQVNPKSTKYAAETLVGPFDDLVTFLLNYYDIPPDR